MASKVDVSVSLNEVLAKLAKDGTLRKTLLAVAEEKAGGKPVGNINLANQTELTDKDLQAVTGGITSSATSIDYSSLRSPTSGQIDAGKLASADTRW